MSLPPAEAGAQPPGRPTPAAIGNIAASDFLVVDIRNLTVEEVRGLQGRLIAELRAPSAPAPESFAPLLGSLMTISAETAKVGLLATNQGFLDYLDPDNDHPTRRHSGSTTWNALRREANPGARESRVAQSNPVVSGLLDRLFVRTEPEQTDPHNLRAAMDVNVLHELLRVGYPAILDMRNIGTGMARKLTHFANDSLGLTGDDRLPIR